MGAQWTAVNGKDTSHTDFLLPRSAGGEQPRTFSHLVFKRCPTSVGSSCLTYVRVAPHPIVTGIALGQGLSPPPDLGHHLYTLQT